MKAVSIKENVQLANATMSFYRALVNSSLKVFLSGHELANIESWLASEESICYGKVASFSLTKNEVASINVTIEVRSYDEHWDNFERKINEDGDEVKLCKPFIELRLSSNTFKSIERMHEFSKFISDVYEFVKEEYEKIKVSLGEELWILSRTKEEFEAEKKVNEKAKLDKMVYAVVVHNMRRMRVGGHKSVSVPADVSDGTYEQSVDNKKYLLMVSAQYGSSLKRLT